MTDDTAPHALVVDDDALIRMEAAEILMDAGFRPWEACDSDDAIKILEESGEQIQLLFTDVHMPGRLDGFGLARSARLVGRTSRYWSLLEKRSLIPPTCPIMLSSSANRSVPRSCTLVCTRFCLTDKSPSR